MKRRRLLGGIHLLLIEHKWGVVLLGLEFIIKQWVWNIYVHVFLRTWSQERKKLSKHKIVSLCGSRSLLSDTLVNKQGKDIFSCINWSPIYLTKANTLSQVVRFSEPMALRRASEVTGIWDRSLVLLDSIHFALTLSLVMNFTSVTSVQNIVAKGVDV